MLVHMANRKCVADEVMTRVPRGYPADHPRAGLLRHRSLIVARWLEADAVRDVEPVYRACERLRPLLTWLAGHAAAARERAGAGLAENFRW